MRGASASQRAEDGQLRLRRHSKLTASNQAELGIPSPGVLGHPVEVPQRHACNDLWTPQSPYEASRMLAGVSVIIYNSVSYKDYSYPYYRLDL